MKSRGPLVFTEGALQLSVKIRHHLCPSVAKKNDEGKTMTNNDIAAIDISAVRQEVEKHRDIVDPEGPENVFDAAGASQLGAALGQAVDAAQLPHIRE